MSKWIVKEFFDAYTFSLTYVVYDVETKDAIIIDPVWNYNEATGKLSEESVLELCSFIQAKELKVYYTVETHAHADHLTGSYVLKEKYLKDIKIGIGEKITEVQDYFKKVFAIDHVAPNGGDFDLLFKDQETYRAGSLSFRYISTKGHTPACGSYLFEDREQNGFIFTGDALFMPDSGTGRCDFPNGSATDLYHSINKIYKLSDLTEVYTAHDYQPNNRSLLFRSTIGEEKEKNIQLNKSTSLTEFLNFRTERDKTLKAPRLLLPALQVNICAGKLPPAESNGTRYLKIPCVFELK